MEGGEAMQHLTNFLIITLTIYVTLWIIVKLYKVIERLWESL
jgi:hypothetical protein